MINNQQSMQGETILNSSDINKNNISAVSPAITRLMNEIRNKADNNSIGGSYDRTHNRHNRGQ